MSSSWQTIIALFIVALAATLLVRSLVQKRKNPGCSSGCGCPTDKFKSQLKR